jgi:hypothetical protein
MKFMKRFRLPGGRSVAAYMDITNVLNTKHLNGSGLSDSQAYSAYVFSRRSLGENVKWGDSSTFYILNEPYKNDPAALLWKAPLSPSTDWIQFLNPRFYRFGVRFEL